MKFTIDPFGVFKKLLVLIWLLLIANMLAILLKFTTDSLALRVLSYLFDFNKELNIPSIFATLLLLVSAGLLFYVFVVVKRQKGSYVFHWLALSLIFAFLALDEIGSLHERLIFVLQKSYGFDGYLYYGWVIPYGIATLLLGFVILPFLKKLPKKISILFLVSGFIFVTGAVGLEMIGGNHDASFGSFNLQYTVYYTFEEFLEMLGVSIFIYALLAYIKDYTDVISLRIQIEDSEPKEAPSKSKTPINVNG